MLPRRSPRAVLAMPRTAHQDEREDKEATEASRLLVLSSGTQRYGEQRDSGRRVHGDDTISRVVRSPAPTLKCP